MTPVNITLIHVPPNPTLASVLNHILNSGPSMYTAEIGGWCTTYSATNVKSGCSNSNVSPNIGLNGFFKQSSIATYLDNVNAITWHILIHESLICAAFFKLST